MLKERKDGQNMGKSEKTLRILTDVLDGMAVSIMEAIGLPTCHLPIKHLDFKLPLLYLKSQSVINEEMMGHGPYRQGT